MSHTIILNYDHIKKLEDRVLQNKAGFWIKRGIRTGDIIRIKAYLEKHQSMLFPAAGLMIVIRIQDGFFNEEPGGRLLTVFSYKRGIFVIEAESCEIEIGGYYDP
jgi:hypothetical protein